MDTGETDLGYVFLALGNNALKFGVTAIDKLHSTDEPLNQCRIWYMFSAQTKSKHSETNRGFTLRVSKKFTNAHDRAIRAGLTLYSENPDEDGFVLTPKVYDNLNEKYILTGRKLWAGILHHISVINEQWASEMISHFDLADSLFADENEIAQCLQDLCDGGFIVKGKFKLHMRRGIKAFVYRINPNNYARIEQELASELTKADAKKPNVRPLIFLSYKHDDRILAGKIKSELESRGMDVFLAHEDIDPTEKWINKILQALDRCDVFMPLLTSNFRQSEWTDQEAGNAIARNKLILSLKFKDNPHGFLKDYQALPFREEKIADSCEHITNTIIDKLGVTPAIQRHSANNQ